MTRSWFSAAQRMVSHYQALVYGTMGAVASAYEATDAEFGTESASAEIACALHLTRRSADAELGLALELRERVPKVFHALDTGSIAGPNRVDARPLS